MAENVSEQFFNAAVKAELSKAKSGFDGCGVWIDWNINDGVLKGHFAIPVQRVVNRAGSGCNLVASDFLNYTAE